MQKLSPFEVSEICDELGEPHPKNIEQVYGGDIHSAWKIEFANKKFCLLYTSPSPRDRQKSRMPSSA